MRLIVFGGTGQTGSAVLKTSIEDPDLEVTAFVRSPNKIPTAIRRKLKVVTGNVLESADVDAALQGQEAVISCLGTGFYIGDTTVMSRGIENIIHGMRKNEVDKLAVVGVSFLLPGHYTPYILKKTTADHERALNIIRKANDIRWTVAMAPEISRVPRGCQYKVAINKIPGGNVVATLDLAEWMLSTVKHNEEMNEYQHQLVGISSNLGTKDWLIRTLKGRMDILGGWVEGNGISIRNTTARISCM